MARTTITVPDDLLAEAATYRVNVSEAARRGVRDAVEAARITAQLESLSREGRERPLALPPGALAQALRELRDEGEMP